MFSVSFNFGTEFICFHQWYDDESVCSKVTVRIGADPSAGEEDEAAAAAVVVVAAAFFGAAMKDDDDAAAAPREEEGCFFFSAAGVPKAQLPSEVFFTGRTFLDRAAAAAVR